MTVEDLTATKHAAPCSNQDFDFFYSGLEHEALLAQQCSACRKLRNPPSPMCGACGSLEWSAVRLSGRGAVYSFVVHHYPPLPGFDTPHPIALVELDEGLRFIGAVKPADRDKLAIGRPAQVEYVRRDGVALFQFAIAGENR